MNEILTLWQGVVSEYFYISDTSGKKLKVIGSLGTPDVFVTHDGGHNFTTEKVPYGENPNKSHVIGLVGNTIPGSYVVAMAIAEKTARDMGATLHDKTPYAKVKNTLRKGKDIISEIFNVFD
jgi:hypothetical protein